MFPPDNLTEIDVANKNKHAGRDLKKTPSSRNHGRQILKNIMLPT